MSVSFIKEDSKYKVYYKNGVLLGEVISGDDGFFAFWPELRGGFWEAHVLRAIADNLDKINAPWEKQIEAYFDNDLK